MLELKIVAQNDKKSNIENQSMNIQQLNDLQSKLMLVAGKALEGKEQVDEFVEVGFFDMLTSPHKEAI